MSYTLNHVNEQSFGDKILISTDHGGWAALSNDERDQVMRGTLSEASPLYAQLEERGIIITDKNAQRISVMMQRKYGHLYTGTSLHVLDVTKRCNHGCPYCHSAVVGETAKGYDMDEDTCKKAVDFMFQTTAPSFTIEFQGGEPLLNWHIIQYATEYAEKKSAETGKKVSFALVTNLSKMDYDILDYCIKHEYGLCTSLDGPERVHNKNRTYFGGNSYSSVVKWIKEIQSRNYPINALMVATKYSLQFPEEIVDEYFKLGLPGIKLRHLDNIGFAQATRNLIGYEAEEYVQFWQRAMERVVYHNKQRRFVERMSQIILGKMHGVWVNYSDFESPCGSVIGQMAYSYNGGIYTCDEGRMFDVFKLGEVGKDTYKGILTSGKSCAMIAASTNVSLYCDTCVFKPWCGVCPVMNYADTGNLVSIIPQDFRHKIAYATFTYMFDKLLNSEIHRKVFMQWLEGQDMPHGCLWR
ncbi:His-Xaa-Ser system radical SAM maturase HxsB [Candidatus Woesearchaeota archaeon]|nr:His-Xaa-Ser system radical SAM maturase HxsB [Candidatus Woesearchaeota archaeon]